MTRYRFLPMFLLVAVVMLFAATNAVSYPNPFNSPNETEGLIIGLANDLSPPIVDITSVITTTSPWDATSMPAPPSTVVAMYNVTGRELRNNNVQMSGANGQETLVNPTAIASAKGTITTYVNIGDSAQNNVPPPSVYSSVQEVAPTDEIVANFEATFDIDYSNPFGANNESMTRTADPPTLNATVNDRTIQDGAGAQTAQLPLEDESGNGSMIADEKYYPNPFA